MNPAEGFDYARGLDPSNLLAFDYTSTPTNAVDFLAPTDFKLTAD